MTERFLVDTSVWIEALRPGGRPDIAAWLKQAILRDSVVLAQPVRTELLIGARDERQSEELKKKLGALPLLEAASQVWERAASLGFRLRRRGRTVPLVDLLIAALALEGSHTLAHRDEHFELIREVEPGLRTLNFIGPRQ